MEDYIIRNLTDDHKKLLYLIQRYSKVAETRYEKEVWIKEIPIRTLVHEGIINGIFDKYDYSPLSVEVLGGRRLLNIRQEAEDDFADLREMKLIDCLKLAGSCSKLTVAYRITALAKKALASSIIIPTEFKEKVDATVNCPECGSLKNIVYDFEVDEFIYIECTNPLCKFQEVSSFTKYGDVSYSTNPYFPVICRNMEYEVQREKMGFVKIDYKKVLNKREHNFKSYYQNKHQLNNKNENKRD